jgi:hypothetical protein
LGVVGEQGFNATLTQLFKSPVSYPMDVVGLHNQIFPVFNMTECAARP